MTRDLNTSVRVGVIGCGNISSAYLTNLKASPDVDVLVCADAVMERAQSRAVEFGVPRACTTQELLADPEVELVVNLTVPAAHAPIGLAVLEAGKHLYNEKPLATSREDGVRLLDAAAARGLMVGCAPDTFLGAGIQTCLRMLEAREVGEPLAASAFMLDQGPENWHPDPSFFYQPGGGPLLDMGPYYLTALTCALGPVRRVTGMARTLFPQRKANRGPRAGETFIVSTPTFVTALLEFEGGAVATLVTSLGISGHDLPHLQLYCSDGILSVPDPNTFGGPVGLRSSTDGSTWRDIPLRYPHTDSQPPRNLRGLGVVDMARALRDGGSPRASGALAYHALDIMVSILESHETGRHIDLSSTCSRPPLLPLEADFELAPGEGNLELA